MSTPAISRDERRYRGGQFRLLINGTIVIDRPNTDHEIWHVLHERPASVSSPLLADGFRYATNWTNKYSYRPAFFPLPVWENSFTYYGTLYQKQMFEITDWSFGGYPSFNPLYLEERAINGALEKLKNQRVNLGVMFGERKETARMFQDVITSIARDVRNFKRGKPKDWQRVIRSGRTGGRGAVIPASWLALQYGWKPGMSDVYDSAQALAEKEARGAEYNITVTKTVSAADISKFQQSFDTAGYDLVWKRRADRGVHVSLTYNLNNSFVRTLTQIGVTNPASIVWELVPYSFVLDWALPIGEWLGLMDADFGWSFRDGAISRLSKDFAVVDSLIKARNNNEGSPSVIKNDFVRVQGLDSLRYYAWDFKRNVLSSSPFPRIYLKNPLSLGHVANATALLAAALNRTSK